MEPREAVTVDEASRRFASRNGARIQTSARWMNTRRTEGAHPVRGEHPVTERSV